MKRGWPHPPDTHPCKHILGPLAAFSCLVSQTWLTLVTVTGPVLLSVSGCCCTAPLASEAAARPAWLLPSAPSFTPAAP